MTILCDEIMLQIDLDAIIRLAQYNNQKIYLTNANFDIDVKWSNETQVLSYNYEKSFVLLREYIYQHIDKLIKIIFLSNNANCNNDILVYTPYKFNMTKIKKKLMNKQKYY